MIKSRCHSAGSTIDHAPMNAGRFRPSKRHPITIVRPDEIFRGGPRSLAIPFVILLLPLLHQGRLGEGKQWSEQQQEAKQHGSITATPGRDSTLHSQSGYFFPLRSLDFASGDLAARGLSDER